MPQQPLDYHGRIQQGTTNESRRAAVCIGIGAGLGAIITLPSLFLALLSAGAGHGDYASARLLFPIPLLLTRATGDSIGPVSIVLALTQYAIYGAVLGWSGAASPLRLAIAAAIIVILHSLAAMACFAGAVPNFS